MDTSDRVIASLVDAGRVLSNPREHLFAVVTPICAESANCTEVGVAASNRYTQVPGQSDAVFHGGVELARAGAKYGGPVMTIFEGLTVTNITLPGHTLYPGYIARTPLAYGGTVYMVTIGGGRGILPGTNEAVGRGLFKGLDDALRRRMSGR